MALPALGVGTEYRGCMRCPGAHPDATTPRPAAPGRAAGARVSSRASARRRYTVLDMDPVRNPYAPGAGQRPPELAGRDGELRAFDVVLERVARGRPERSMVLVGLRGVGKTVLLNTLRGAALQHLWGTGKIEARPGQSMRGPLASALYMAAREIAPRHRDPERVDAFLATLKAFALKSGNGRWHPGIDVLAARGRADTGDLEIDLVELLGDAAAVARDVGTGIALFIDEMQDLPPGDVDALCGACHELSQTGGPLVVVGAGLPHLPAVLSASKSYSERLFRYARIDRLEREDADRALAAPAAEEEVAYDPAALDGLYAATEGSPYFAQAYGKAVWDAAPQTPITAADVRVAVPEAERELAVGFFGSRYERATPAEREYMRTMADLGAESEDGPVSTSAIAAALARKPSSLSPVRDGLLKKGLVYSAERGSVSFTVPHFGRFLRQQAG